MEKIKTTDIGGETIKDNSQYLLKDNKTLNDLIVSSTFLHANQFTNGHSHKDQEEVYIFTKGEGEMQIDDKRFSVKDGDIVLVEKGEFHKVFNTSDIGLLFVCVFQGKRNHK